jgi:membrane protein
MNPRGRSSVDLTAPPPAARDNRHPEERIARSGATLAARSTVALGSSHSRVVVLQLLGRTVQTWSRGGAGTQAAAIAFFALFSIAPVLILIVSIADLVFRRSVAQSRILDELGDVMGSRAAAAVQTVLEHARFDTSGPLARIAGFLAFALGATAAFMQLQSALNQIWDVERQPGPALRDVLRKRLLSFALVIAIGFVLLLSLVVSAVTTALAGRLDSLIHVPADVLESVNLSASVAILTGLFAVMFRFLPDVELPWSDVGAGALVTALLVTAGRWGIGLYLGHSALASTYGAAASMVVILLWIYYGAMIVLLGAAFTRAWSEIVNRRQRVPKEGARRAGITEEDFSA